MAAIVRQRPTLRLSYLYDALKEAGVDEELAQQASQEAAEYLRARSAYPEIADFHVIHWMAALNIVLSAIILLQLFTPG